MLNKVLEQNQIYVDVANLHIKSLKTGFLPSLGVGFLSLMYRCIDEANFSTLIVKYENDRLAGFVSGTLGTSSLYKAMLHYPIRLSLALMPILLNLRKARKILNIVTHMSGEERAKYPPAELLTICVDEDFRRRGVAENLYGKLSSYFKAASSPEFVIVVGQYLDANAFYENQGAHLSGELEVHSGARSNVFVHKV